MDAFLRDAVAKRSLRSKKDYLPALEQIAGKHIIFEILNIIEILTQNDHKLCYCCKYFGCAPHFYSGKYYL